MTSTTIISSQEAKLAKQRAQDVRQAMSKLEFRPIENNQWEIWLGLNRLGLIIKHDSLGWSFQTALNFSHNLNSNVLQQINDFVADQKRRDNLGPNEDLEDYKAAERIFEGSIRPGLTLHEARQILALLEMGWTDGATRQLRDFIGED